jgi:predicted dehydrogenase
MRKIKTAIIGSGFMGKVHTEAVRRLGNVEVIALASSPRHDAAKLAHVFDIPHVASSWKNIVKDPEVEVVHVCTPNALHFPVSMAAMEAGKHVICEKPLAMSVAEAKQMVELAKKNKLANCVNHNLRYYPVVQHIREMIANGELGDILIVQGTYSQDWLLYDTDYNWRIESKFNGPLRVVGDVGSHWMDMIQHLTGLKITALCADLQIFHKKRKKPKGNIETFAGKLMKPEDYTEVRIDTEDFGSVLLQLGKRARGAYTVSQVSAGCKNRFQIEIFGTRAGVMWNQEKPDELWIGHRNTPNHLIVKDPSLLHSGAATYADLPGGHSEGYDDTHKQVFKRFYHKVLHPTTAVEYPTLEDGLRGMMLLEKVIESNKNRAWVDC